MPLAKIRDAVADDIQDLALIASQGFSTSPAYRFVRVKADIFPQDTVRSYERQYTKFLADPSVVFHCILQETEEVESEPVHAIKSENRTNKCLSEGCNESNKKRIRTAGQKIMGFAIWRLDPKSGKIDRSLFRRLKFTYVSLLDRLTSIFWKPRDSIISRSLMIGQKCEEIYEKRKTAGGMELEQMVIHPDFQRKGFGTMLGLRGLEIAQNENCKICVIATPIGERLYEKLGFKKIGEVEAEDGEEKCKLVVQEWEPIVSLQI